MFDLSDKVAIVVGGAGGLGRPNALGYAKFGADVVVTSRSLDDCQKVADEIEEVGSNSMAVQTDVTDEQDVKDMVDKVMDEFGQIDILVNWAGLNIPKPAEDYPLEDFEKVIDVHVKGHFLCAREVGNVMIDQGEGHIINVSSVRGGFALPRNYLGYCTAKGAINMFTKQLACEWGKFGVNVNAIAPTVIETPLTEHILEDPDMAEKFKRGIALGRWGQPEDLIGTLVYLGSDASNFITGQIIYVDGGTTTYDTID